jgi:hypothetical protein
MKIQNGGYVQDGVENVYIFQNDFLPFFLLFSITNNKNITLMEKISFENSK